MLTEYIQAAMREAHYEMMEDSRFYARIPPCKGLWADGDTLETCRAELQSTLEDWLLLGLQFGDRIPVIDGIDLNPRGRGARAATVGRRAAMAAMARRKRPAAHV